MFVKSLAIAAALTLAASGALAAGKASPVKQLMTNAVTPASNTIFAVGGEVDPGAGGKVKPARWVQGAAAARQLHTAALNLQKPGVARAGADWKRYSIQLASAADRAAKAAAAKNGAGFSKAANDMGETCGGCHAKYQGRS